MDIITIYNNKGGVGKTTLTINIAACLSKRKYSVLVVDTDPQANTTKQLLGYAENKPEKYLEDIFTDDKQLNFPISDCIQHVFTKNKNKIIRTKIDIIPIAKNNTVDSNISVEYIADCIRLVNEDKYDFVIIDTNPTVSRNSFSALFAADFVLVPMLADRYSLDGWNEVINVIEEVKTIGNNSLRILGAVINNFIIKSSTNKFILNQCGEVIGEMLFENIIRQSYLIDSASFQSIPISYFREKSTCAEDLFGVTDEMLQRIREIKRGVR